MALAAPLGFRIVTQRVALMSNEVVLSWSGTAPTYRLALGSSSNGSDIRNVDLTVTSYTFQASRTAVTYYARVFAGDGQQVSAPSTELTIGTLDLRDIMDALFFRAGPMSDGRAIQPGTTPAAVWPTVRTYVYLCPMKRENVSARWPRRLSTNMAPSSVALSPAKPSSSATTFTRWPMRDNYRPLR